MTSWSKSYEPFLSTGFGGVEPKTKEFCHRGEGGHKIPQPNVFLPYFVCVLCVFFLLCVFHKPGSDGNAKGTQDGKMHGLSGRTETFKYCKVYYCFT